MVSLPGAFTISGPTGTQTQQNNIVTWTESASATSYQFVLSQHADLSFPLYNETVTGTSKAVSVVSGTYYISVKAVNSNGEAAAENNGFSFSVELPPVDQLIFVTSIRYFVSATNSYPPAATSFGSARAADYHCTSVANTSGLVPNWDGSTIHFRALVTEGSVGISSRVGMLEDEYFNVSGQVVAATRAQLLSGSFTAPVQTQSGTVLTGTQPVWTGALTDGSAAASKCDNWSNPVGGTVLVGNVNGTGTNWLSQATVSCASQQRLYCVGKRPTP
jgi:hypothetical protein